MLVIALIAQKGGAGKTTLSLALATEAAREGLTTVVIDLDPQASALSWRDRREAQEPYVVPAQPPRLAQILEAAEGEGAELAVIDTAPRVEQTQVAAAGVANLVLMPSSTSALDLETLVTTTQLVRAVNTDVPILAVLNRTPARGQREPRARELLERLGIAVVPGSIGLRADVEYATTEGLVAAELAPGGKAALEFSALYAHAAGLLGQQPATGAAA